MFRVSLGFHWGNTKQPTQIVPLEMSEHSPLPHHFTTAFISTPIRASLQLKKPPPQNCVETAEPGVTNRHVVTKVSL